MRTPFNRSGSPFGTNLPTPARTPQGSGLAANVPATLRNLGAQAFPSLRPGNPPLALGSTAVEDFFKGCITTGLLVTLQERAERARNADGKPAGKRLDRRAVRMALQGGAALSAGTAPCASPAPVPPCSRQPPVPPSFWPPNAGWPIALPVRQSSRWTTSSTTPRQARKTRPPATSRWHTPRVTRPEPSTPTSISRIRPHTLSLGPRVVPVPRTHALSMTEN